MYSLVLDIYDPSIKIEIHFCLEVFGKRVNTKHWHKPDGNNESGNKRKQ